MQQINTLYSNGYYITLQEIPDEISLTFVIYGCDVHCPDCHSKHLWNTSDRESLDLFPVTKKKINELLERYKQISCVLFMGGEWKPDVLLDLIKHCTKHNKKVALYSGRGLEYFFKEGTNPLCHYLTYLKVGPYNKNRGGLDNPKTNQELFYVYNAGICLENITYKLQRGAT